MPWLLYCLFCHVGAIVLSPVTLGALLRSMLRSTVSCITYSCHAQSRIRKRLPSVNIVTATDVYYLAYDTVLTRCGSLATGRRLPQLVSLSLTSRPPVEATVTSG